jgi:hypothetical protein
MTWWMPVVWAAPNAAEQLRLEEELGRLAQKNAWSGVDRVYRELVSMEVPLPCDVHLSGAQAARADGRVTLAYLRLNRMVEPDPNDDPLTVQAWQVGRQELVALLDGFRFTAIHVGEPTEPTLDRPLAPFGQVERGAVEVARSEVSSTRTFRGLLPVGDYVIGGQAVTIAPGEGWQVVTVGFP